jgi:hypothetical protein
MAVYRKDKEMETLADFQLAKDKRKICACNRRTSQSA